MSILTKISLSLLVIVVGSLVGAVIKDLVGHGQYIASGIIVIILFFIWGKAGPAKNIEGDNK